MDPNLLSVEEVAEALIELNGALQSLTPLEKAIWRTVAYGDVFAYPITMAEIHRYLEGFTADFAKVETTIQQSSALGRFIASERGYFFLTGRSEIVQIRQQREAASQQLLAHVGKYGRLISKLPFVRMVALTGSLAMNNVDEEADIDFLIVTRKRRVWLARFLIVGVVRWAARQQVHLCPNFILSETALNFERRNLYVAREMAQMVPLYGSSLYEKLRTDNDWTEQFLPNASGMPGVRPIAPAASNWIKHAFERLLQGRLGDRLDAWEMKRKIAKFQRLGLGKETAFSPEFCKGHFDAHEARTLSAYQAKIDGNHS